MDRETSFSDFIDPMRAEVQEILEQLIEIKETLTEAKKILDALTVGDKTLKVNIK